MSFQTWSSRWVGREAWLPTLFVSLVFGSLGCGTMNTGQSYLIGPQPFLEMSELDGIGSTEVPLRVEFERQTNGRRDLLFADLGVARTLWVLNESNAWAFAQPKEDADLEIPGAEMELVFNRQSPPFHFGRAVWNSFKLVFTLGILGYENRQENYRVEATYRAPDLSDFRLTQEWQILSYTGLLINPPKEATEGKGKAGSRKHALWVMQNQVGLNLISQLKERGAIP